MEVANLELEKCAGEWENEGCNFTMYTKHMGRIELELNKELFQEIEETIISHVKKLIKSEVENNERP